MKKILIFLVATVAFLLSAPSAYGFEQVAGSSAQLTSVEDNQTSEDEWIKELAIRNVLTKYDSPMTDEAESFMLVARTLELNPYMLPSIAGVESRFGNVLIQGTNNPFGWNVGRTKFYSWSEGIAKVGYALKYKYYERGAEDLYDVGRIYAGGSETWTPKVLAFMKQFEDEEERIRRVYTL